MCSVILRSADGALWLSCHNLRHWKKKKRIAAIDVTQLRLSFSNFFLAILCQVCSCQPIYECSYSVSLFFVLFDDDAHRGVRYYVRFVQRKRKVAAVIFRDRERRARRKNFSLRLLPNRCVFLAFVAGRACSRWRIVWLFRVLRLRHNILCCIHSSFSFVLCLIRHCFVVQFFFSSRRLTPLTGWPTVSKTYLRRCAHFSAIIVQWSW